MKIVFDTVILVRGLIGPYSTWGRLLFEGDDRYEWIVSLEIIDEYLEVLHRPELLRKYRAIETRNLRVMLDKIADATVVQPAVYPMICRDPEDDKFLAAAMEAKADFIVTEDGDLLVLQSFEGTQICTAAALATIFERKLRFEEN